MSILFASTIHGIEVKPVPVLSRFSTSFRIISNRCRSAQSTTSITMEVDMSHDRHRARMHSWPPTSTIFSLSRPELMILCITPFDNKIDNFPYILIFCNTLSTKLKQCNFWRYQIESLINNHALSINLVNRFYAFLSCTFHKDHVKLTNFYLKVIFWLLSRTV